MNVYLNPKTVLCLNFWRKKQLKNEIRTSFNMELYLRIIEAKNK